MHNDRVDRAAIRQEIEEAYSSLHQLKAMFEGREVPVAVLKMERTIRAQLEAVQALLKG